MMKQILIAVLLVTGIAFPEHKDNIAVMDLQSNSIAVQDLEGLSNRLSNEIFKTKRYTVFERSRISDILNEQGFQQSGCTNTECAVEAGQLIGVHKIGVGNIDKVGTTFAGVLTDEEIMRLYQE